MRNINELCINSKNFVITANAGLDSEKFRTYKKSDVSFCSWAKSSKNFNVVLLINSPELVFINVSKADALIASEALQSEDTHDFTSAKADSDEDEESHSDKDGEDVKSKPSVPSVKAPVAKPPTTIEAPFKIGADASKGVEGTKAVNGGSSGAAI